MNLIVHPDLLQDCKYSVSWMKNIVQSEFQNPKPLEKEGNCMKIGLISENPQGSSTSNWIMNITGINKVNNEVKSKLLRKVTQIWYRNAT